MCSIVQSVLTQVQQRIANRDQQMLLIDLEDVVKVCQWFTDLLQGSYGLNSTKRLWASWYRG